MKRSRFYRALFLKEKLNIKRDLKTSDFFSSQLLTSNQNLELSKSLLLKFLI